VPEPRIVGMAARVPRMAMPGMTMSGPGGMQMHMDLNDVHYDAFLANDRTLADPQIVRVERGGHIRLRVINGASSSQFWIDLGDLVGRVVATDGHPVHPVAAPRTCSLHVHGGQDACTAIVYPGGDKVQPARRLAG
jgi:hypothetical protein